jgi:spore coat protein CotH
MSILRNRLRTLAAIVVIGLPMAAPLGAQSPTPGSPPATRPQPSDPFFDDTVVHEIRLNISSRDWQALQIHYQDNTYYACDFRWRDQVIRNIGIRSRGSGSRNGVKPGLRVDFDRYVTDQQFLGLKSFVFRNNTQDASSMHERLSMLLFRRLGLPASREAHAKLFINNEYHGLYLIAESIDKTFLRETFNEDDGYLYKYDYPVDAPYYFEDRGPDPGAYVPLPFKPETHETDPRPEFIVQLVQAINQTGEAAFRTVMAEYLDLKKFVKHVAVETFVADSDGFLSDWGGMNNYYLYQSQGRKLFTFIAWDKSEAFKSGYKHNILDNITIGRHAGQNRLLTRALAYPDLYNAYLDALLDCVRSAAEPAPGVTDGPGWLEREVQREYEQIRDAALADPTKPFTNEEFERAASDLGVFARHRGDFVAAAVSAARVR